MPTRTLEDQIVSVQFDVSMLRGLCRSLARLSDHESDASLAVRDIGLVAQLLSERLGTIEYDLHSVQDRVGLEQHAQRNGDLRETVQVPA